MENFFIVGITVSFLLCLLVLSKKNRSSADVIFGIWQASLVIHFSLLYIRYSGLHWEYPHFIALDTSFGLLHAPLLFLYIHSQVGASTLKLKHYLVHTLPFIAVNILLAFSFYFLSAEEKIGIYRNALENTRASITDIIITLQGIGYMAWSHVLIRKFNRRIKANLSSVKKVNLPWLKKLLVILYFVVVIHLIINFLFYLDLFSIFLLGKWNVIIFSFILLVLGYYGIRKTTVFSGGELYPDYKSGLYKKSGLTREEAQNQIDQIRKFMEREKPYLKSDLTLKQLADLLGISTNHLSQAINQADGKNFYEFVNEYRAEEVKNRLKDEKFDHYKILAIAYDAGFNSKSVFNSFFKKLTNTTPTAFKAKFR